MRRSRGRGACGLCLHAGRSRELTQCHGKCQAAGFFIMYKCVWSRGRARSWECIRGSPALGGPPVCVLQPRGGRGRGTGRNTFTGWCLRGSYLWAALQNVSGLFPSRDCRWRLSVPTCSMFPQLSGGRGDAPPRLHTCPRWNQAVCTEWPQGPPVASPAVAAQPASAWTQTREWPLVGVVCSSASLHPAGHAQNLERFLHGHSPPPAGVTLPPSPKPSCTECSPSRDCIHPVTLAHSSVSAQTLWVPPGCSCVSSSLLAVAAGIPWCGWTTVCVACWRTFWSFPTLTIGNRTVVNVPVQSFVRT